MADKSDARIELEKRAAALNLSYQGTIGDAKLEERIKAAEADKEAGKNPPQAPAKKTAKKAAKKAKASGAFLTVTGPREGFWRAGMRFDATPSEFGVGDLTDDQIKSLENEPELTVTKADSSTK